MSNYVASDESKYNNEMTNYPDTYKNCYWSNFKYPNASGPEIINNRNRFAAEYNIKKKKYIPEYIEKKCCINNLRTYYIYDNKLTKEELDKKFPVFSQQHKEYYITEDEYICIFSNYGNEIDENALNFGFIKLPYSLYRECTTMIKTVPIRRKKQ